MGSESIQTTQCDQTNNVCQIKLPAPGFALVYLTDNTSPESGSGPTTTFSTSRVTKAHNTVTVDPGVVATSNGHSGMDQKLGSTSFGSVGAAQRVGVGMGMGWMVMLGTAVGGAVLLVGGIW
jgi:hypothetical protein